MFAQVASLQHKKILMFNKINSYIPKLFSVESSVLWAT